MRARQPDRTGYAVNAGVRLYFEVHGTGRLPILLVPPWAVVTSGFWKMQLPFLARHYAVVLYDPRGNERSTDHPQFMRLRTSPGTRWRFWISWLSIAAPSCLFRGECGHAATWRRTTLNVFPPSL